MRKEFLWQTVTILIESGNARNGTASGIAAGNPAMSGAKTVARKPGATACAAPKPILTASGSGAASSGAVKALDGARNTAATKNSGTGAVMRIAAVTTGIADTSANMRG